MGWSGARGPPINTLSRRHPNAWVPSAALLRQDAVALSRDTSGIPISLSGELLSVSRRSRASVASGTIA